MVTMKSCSSAVGLWMVLSSIFPDSWPVVVLMVMPPGRLVAV